jgi:hypothetical protein
VHTRRPAERSIRRAVNRILRGLAQAQPGSVRPHIKCEEGAATATPAVNSQSTGEAS